MSLIEVLVAVTILSVTLVSLMAASGVALRQLHAARSDTRLWSAVQHQMETLMKAGHDSVSTDSATVDGVPMHWTVTGTNPKKILLTVEGMNGAGQLAEDTVVLYLADPSS